MKDFFLDVIDIARMGWVLLWVVVSLPFVLGLILCAFAARGVEGAAEMYDLLF